MGKKVILILLEILILSCNLLDQDQKTKSSKTKTSKNQDQKSQNQQNQNQKPAAKIIPVVSIQKVEIRKSNQNPTSIENYYKQAYPIQTFSVDFSINRENEFQQTEDKIFYKKGKVESLSILIKTELLDSKINSKSDSKKLTFKKLKEIQNIENFFQNQDLLFVLNLKSPNNNNIINIMLNPPNDFSHPKNYVLLGLKDVIEKGVNEQYLNPIYRFQIKNNKDYHSIDYNKVSISENYIELDLLPHNQVFKMSKNFTKILKILTDVNSLKLVIQEEYI
ncbi:hypothetical protein [Borreliella garinii]|uniref:hypothetical protein n=1 Tax=Borreliella garinii TaxID=29519 RepID=UPI00018ACEDF|nr:hypothetical protein [Borreliella garinii]ACL35157.1 surface lipoprotein P27 [Borreliella garinii Far04]WNZ67230.1 hypothetical protein PT139_05365 [Borreliella garinii]WNZ68228.1 hypothetical protein PT135_05375 [Borreliella garinii]WNZ69228.1 hypothetical protein PT138_05390 [Borreliella garinii]WNZ70228.1 hypothetical protein PT140_05370 [Borreliella garinii]